MALQCVILVPRELCEKLCKTPSPPPVKTILKSIDHGYNKWTRVRLHQDPYLKTEKLKREPIPIPIIETTRKSGPFKLESELETNSQPVHSKYILNVLRRKLSHNPTFGVYQNETDGSFKIGSSTFKYTDKNMLVDDRMYNATQGLWELLTKSKPDKNVVTFQDRHISKYSYSLTRTELIIVPQVR